MFSNVSKSNDCFQQTQKQKKVSQFCHFAIAGKINVLCCCESMLNIICRVLIKIDHSGVNNNNTHNFESIPCIVCSFYCFIFSNVCVRSDGCGYNTVSSEKPVCFNTCTLVKFIIKSYTFMTNGQVAVLKLIQTSFKFQPLLNFQKLFNH